MTFSRKPRLQSESAAAIDMVSVLLSSTTLLTPVNQIIHTTINYTPLGLSVCSAGLKHKISFPAANPQQVGATNPLIPLQRHNRLVADLLATCQDQALIQTP